MHLITGLIIVLYYHSVACTSILPILIFPMIFFFVSVFTFALTRSFKSLPFQECLIVLSEIVRSLSSCMGESFLVARPNNYFITIK